MPHKNKNNMIDRQQSSEAILMKDMEHIFKEMFTIHDILRNESNHLSKIK